MYLSKKETKELYAERVDSDTKRFFVENIAAIWKNYKKAHPEFSVDLEDKKEYYNVISFLHNIVSGIDPGSVYHTQVKKYFPKKMDIEPFANTKGNWYDSKWNSLTDQQRESIFKKVLFNKIPKKSTKRPVKTVKIKIPMHNQKAEEVEVLDISKHFGAYQPDLNKKRFSLTHKSTGMSLFPDLTITKLKKIAKYIEKKYGDLFDFTDQKELTEKNYDKASEMIQDVRNYASSF